MTKQEAIEILDKIKSEYATECSECDNCGDCDYKFICFDFSAIQALNLATQALEQEPSEDLISRQEVIDGLEYEKEMLNRALDNIDIVVQEREKFAWGLGLVECFIEDIKELPSKEIINGARMESDTE